MPPKEHQMDRVRSARLRLSVFRDKLAKTFLRPASIKVMERIPFGGEAGEASRQSVAP